MESTQISGRAIALHGVSTGLWQGCHPAYTHRCLEQGVRPARSSPCVSGVAIAPLEALLGCLTWPSPRVLGKTRLTYHPRQPLRTVASALDVQSLTSIDFCPLPRILIQLVAKVDNLTPLTLRPNVVTSCTIHTNRGVCLVLEVRSPPGEHLDKTAILTASDYDLPLEPLTRWLEIAHDAEHIIPLFPTAVEIETARQVIHGGTTIASAYDLRRMILESEPTDGVSAIHMMAHLSTLSINGQARYWPIYTTIPTSVRVLHPHAARVLHETVGGSCPWLVTDDTVNKDTALACIDDHLTRHGIHSQVKLGTSVTSKATVNYTSDFMPNGNMAPHLM